MHFPNHSAVLGWNLKICKLCLKIIIWKFEKNIFLSKIKVFNKQLFYVLYNVDD